MIIIVVLIVRRYYYMTTMIKNLSRNSRDSHVCQSSTWARCQTCKEKVLTDWSCENHRKPTGLDPGFVDLKRLAPAVEKVVPPPGVATTVSGVKISSARRHSKSSVQKVRDLPNRCKDLCGLCLQMHFWGSISKSVGFHGFSPVQCSKKMSVVCFLVDDFHWFEAFWLR